ncbi:DUF5753 domain-containing protein [Phytohabitans sp. ZYX-F-186]|uniref:DUF5753 domain-containing protein n=1 Tax=Phytohabitans maris TaxID=3071409 RepID=A0ABU0Z7Q1_9ACTN|nr:DUF5753 domain-containing protein [Phytohabitans sp. ZYX-F-186]MDQ7903076.1 DUF5753 domain-containing protein [Phytohabitans sp. ZYX-F-186]
MTTLRTAEPSLRSRWLGRHLRASREDHGFTLRYVERTLGVPYAEIKAAEQGAHLLQVSQVAAVLELYGVCDKEERDLLLELARDVRHLHRWENHVDAPLLTPAMLDFLWLESQARFIRCYSATLVPDLLQLPDYAEAVAQQRIGPTAFPREAAWWGWACEERQRVLSGSPQATIRAVVAEAALHRPPGRVAGVLRRQLHLLAERSTWPHISLQVLPASASYLPGMDTSFAVFDLGQPRGSVATVHGLTDPTIHEERCAAQYGQAFEQLSQAALDSAASAAVIAEAAERSPKREE